MSRGPVRIGVVGSGGFGRLHVRTLAALAEAKLVAVIDRKDASLRQTQTECPGVPIWNKLEEALAQSDAEAWVIATPTDSHISIAQTILKAGLPVLIEKPLAVDLISARKIEPLVAADSRNVMLGHLLLFAPEFHQLLREIQHRGSLGYFHTVRHRGADHLTLYPEETPLRLLMIHDLYMAFVMTKGEEPNRLSARLHPRNKENEDNSDLALAEIEWPSGVWGSFTASFLTPSGMPSQGFDRLEVFGKDWAAQLRLNPQPIEVWGQRAEWPLGLDIVTEDSAPSGWLAEELRCFCRVVRGQTQVPFGARYADALRLQYWLEQLEQSARRNVC